MGVKMMIETIDMRKSLGSGPRLGVCVVCGGGCANVLMRDNVVSTNVSTNNLCGGGWDSGKKQQKVDGKGFMPSTSSVPVLDHSVGTIPEHQNTRTPLHYKPAGHSQGEKQLRLLQTLHVCCRAERGRGRDVVLAGSSTIYCPSTYIHT